jgi:hypothetical protein
LVLFVFLALIGGGLTGLAVGWRAGWEAARAAARRNGSKPGRWGDPDPSQEAGA